ncbi:hypothetical protein [Neolewinella litorea]|uniref:DUF1851 domain-containing protein n=1 Tax=Neolewinella litorea TaxID=2562452 RepID=A0A4S4NI58_9BACT|nr:hypothetical protein [Neolewinella litorea]THH39402.1 hypothetical protein E4021_11655 [Neolewinella litorea]
MASAIDAFKQAFGDPAGAPEVPLVFPAAWAQGIWSYFVQEAGVGPFRDGFLHLFTERVQTLSDLLDDWSFLFADQRERWVIGTNAYGALLVLEDPIKEGTKGRVGLVDPLEVRYFSDPNLTLMSLLGRWLPEDRLPHFLNDRVYQDWLTTHPGGLAFGDILAIKTPLPLGGKMALENFQVEPIASYYATTGPLYRKSWLNEG